MLRYLNNLDYEELIARISFCAFISFCFYLLVNRAVFSVVMEYFKSGIYFQMKVGLYELPDLLNPEACDSIIDYCKDKVEPLNKLNGFRSAYGMWLNPATHTGMERIIRTIQD